MNVLEKILEEIEHEAMTNKEIGRKQCEGMARAMNIVSSHLNEFLNCEIGNNCHVYDIDKIICSHMDDEDNDDWIPVEDGLPEDCEEIVLVQVSGRPAKNILLDNAFEFACYEKEEGWILDNYPGWKNLDVIAWQPLPEPYKPKKDIEDSGARS